MTEGTVESIHIYPVKSLRGISVTSATVEPRGFRHDRRFMLVDERGEFLTQRSHPTLSKVAVSLEPEAMVCSVVAYGNVRVPLAGGSSSVPVRVWKDACEALDMGPESTEFFSRYLGTSARLVRMPESTRRTVDPRYATSPSDIVSFADGFPFLIARRASLEALAPRGTSALSMDRFRPNIVLAGGDPFDEDRWSRLSLGSLTFQLVKPCARCSMVSVDPISGEVNKEPLATLARARTRDGQVYFGENAVALQTGTLAVGDSARVHTWKSDP